MEKLTIRGYIKTRALLEIPAIEIFRELKVAYPTQCPSYKCVAAWTRKFKACRESIEDDPRSGRQITALTDENISIVKELIESDARLTIDDIEAETSISRSSIFRILHDCLGKRNLAGKWVPHHLTEQNRQERVNACKYNLEMFNTDKWRICDVVTGDESWFFLRQIGSKQSRRCWLSVDQTPPTTVKIDRYEPKFMFSVFFKSTGPVHISYVDKGETIDAQIYIRRNLQQVVQTINHERPTSGTKNMKFHHDNASVHTAESVISYLERKGFKIMWHPPWSPDLAPCDFWLFKRIKQHLSDAKDVKSLKSQITEILSEIPKEEYVWAFNNWLERMQLCIDVGGDYIEHLKNK